MVNAQIESNQIWEQAFRDEKLVLLLLLLLLSLNILTSREPKRSIVADLLQCILDCKSPLVWKTDYIAVKLKGWDLRLGVVRSRSLEKAGNTLNESSTRKELGQA